MSDPTTTVHFVGTPVAGGQGTWRTACGNNGIAIYNGDGSVTLT